MSFSNPVCVFLLFPFYSKKACIVFFDEVDAIGGQEMGFSVFIGRMDADGALFWDSLFCFSNFESLLLLPFNVP